MVDLNRAEQYGVLTATGFITGFAWSVLAGRADLTKSSGWRDALIGATGSAIQTASLYAITEAVSTDSEMPWRVATIWLGAQATSGAINTLGTRAHLEDNPLYKSIAIPVNFITSPGFSSYGALHALAGEIAIGFDGEVTTYGPTIVFNHKLCGYRAPFNTGIFAHCFNADTNKQTARHEMGHGVQLSIMGDIGYSAFLFVDGLFQIPFGFLFGPGGFTTEPWAQRYEKAHKLTDTNLKISDR